MDGQSHKSCLKDISEFSKGFIKIHNDKSDEGCFLEVDV